MQLYKLIHIVESGATTASKPAGRWLIGDAMGYSAAMEACEIANRSRTNANLNRYEVIVEKMI